MMQKFAKKNQYTRATLADIEREMAKPRLAESVRRAAEVAEEEDSLARPLPKLQKKSET